MTPSRFFLVLFLPLLVACKLLPQVPDQLPQSSTEQTELAADVLADGDPLTVAADVRPKPRPTADPEAAEAKEGAEGAPVLAPVVDPVASKTKAQISCEKQGGNWGKVGKSRGETCFKRTRDAGKQCRKQSNCESLCLARSGTCAPVKPLFGCNEILQDDGRRVTLCVD